MNSRIRGNDLTGRVEQLRLKADSFTDQRLLTALAEMLSDGGTLTVKPKGRLKIKCVFGKSTVRE